MEPDKLNDYWTYIPFIDSNKNKAILAFFNEPGYENRAFLYTGKKIKDYNIPFNMKSIREVSSFEEGDLIKVFSEDEKSVYFDILSENKLSEYYMYVFEFNKENIDNFIKFLSIKYSSSSKNKGDIMKKYEEFDNKNQLTFYIIVRNDLNRSIGLQMADVSDLTRVIQEDLRDKALKDDRYAKDFYDFVNMKINTVVLQASGKDLFEDNVIPSEYKDPKILFNYIWDDEERIAHGNFRLKEGAIVCLGYFGYKRDMPKFVKNLKLYGGK